MKTLETIISRTINKAKQGLKSLAYAGLATIAIAGGMREARGENFNSVVKDNIEYYMQTDKAVYNLEENVEMLYRVKNLGEEDVKFDFSFGPEYRQSNFIVKKNGERIWDTIDWPVTWSGTDFTLTFLESKEYIQVWDMTYNNKDKIIPANYDVTGVLNYWSSHERYVPVLVQIDIIPEPSTLSLLAIGSLAGAGIYTLRRRKNK
ncbi:MAG: PEP-CTERM sorting domain-containing protein [Nanoarchaeota archaeon]|nr:PEP-CTERM sorting domain-containing protein [Nanoarchaeota archaeon]